MDVLTREFDSRRRDRRRGARWEPVGVDQAQLATSFARFMGVDGYDLLAELRTDLARFTFLLGHDDDGEQPQP